MTSLIEWVRANMMAPRHFKQPQLWIWGEPNTRKTSFVHLLMPYFRFYLVPHEEFDDLYDDDLYEAAFLDEYMTNVRTCSWITRFAQGDQMPIRLKGAQKRKSKNLPLIVCSNFPIQLVFKTDERPAVQARFTEIHVTEPLPLDNLEFLSTTIEVPNTPPHQ